MWQPHTDRWGDYQLRAPVRSEFAPVTVGINNASPLKLLAPGPGAQQTSSLKESLLSRVAQSHILPGRSLIGADTIPRSSFAAFSSVMPKPLRTEPHQIAALCCLQDQISLLDPEQLA